MLIWTYLRNTQSLGGVLTFENYGYFSRILRLSRGR